MNWLDIVILAILAVAAIGGLRTGLLGAAVNAVAIYVGWILAGQLSGKVGSFLTGSISSETVVTVVSYAIIIILSVIVARIAWKIVKPILTTATLGLSAMVDKLGGLALGLLVGFAVAGAVIIAMARFAYNFSPPGEGIAGRVVDLTRVEDTRQRVESTLVESAGARTFVKIASALPGNALGFVPAEFKLSLEILKQRIDSRA